MFGHLGIGRKCWLLLVALSLVSGCTGTQVIFKTMVKPPPAQMGGWQEACLEALFQNMTTLESSVCLVSIGMPIQSHQYSFISSWDASQFAADCINDASAEVVQPAPPSTPTALACMSFKNELMRLMNDRVKGSRVTFGCPAGVPHTRIGF